MIRARCSNACLAARIGGVITLPFPGEQRFLAEYKEMLSRYQWGVIVHAADKSLSQKISLALESRAFHDGYYFAFSLSDCALCGKCAATENAPCRFPRMARPAFHSGGSTYSKR